MAAISVKVNDIPNKVLMDKLNTMFAKPIIARVGWLESQHEPNGVQTGYVAMIQEYGYVPKNIPPRPFFRPTIEARSNVWQKIIAYGAQHIMDGNATLTDVMTHIADQAAGDFRRAIAKVSTPALKPSTLAARRSRGNSSQKPLSDTRTMMQSLTYTVTNK